MEHTTAPPNGTTVETVVWDKGDHIEIVTRIGLRADAVDMDELARVSRVSTRMLLKLAAVTRS